jgi:hypothetical protein
MNVPGPPPPRQPISMVVMCVGRYCNGATLQLAIWPPVRYRFALSVQSHIILGSQTGALLRDLRKSRSKKWYPIFLLIVFVCRRAAPLNGVVEMLIWKPLTKVNPYAAAVGRSPPPLRSIVPPAPKKSEGIYICNFVIGKRSKNDVATPWELSPEHPATQLLWEIHCVTSSWTW